MKPTKPEEIIPEGTSFLILYGSQLGNAESIAEGLLDTALSEYALDAKLLTLNQLSTITELAKIRCPIVIVTSSTGDGEAPENADKFFRKLRRRVLKPKTLESIRYTILGLGDTNFNNFCNCPKIIHKRFQELGATLFYDPAWADDAVGLEQTVEPWTDDLWPNLITAIEETENITSSTTESKPKRVKSPIKRLFSKMSTKNKDATQTNSTPLTEPMAQEKDDKVALTLPPCPKSTLLLKYSDIEKVGDNSINLSNPPAPYPLIDGATLKGTIMDGKLLTSAGSVKTTVELTIKIDEKFEFEPGDAIGIVCPNSSEEVERLILRLEVTDKVDKPCTLLVKPDLKGKVPVHIPKESTIRQMLLWYCDIRTPLKKALLRLLAEHTSDANEKDTLLNLCSRQGSTLYEKLMRQHSTSLLDILLQFPSCKPPVESLLEYLPRLAPRPYSISSSPLTSPGTFTIAFNIIKFSMAEEPEAEYRKYNRLGVCTGWLYSLGMKYFTKGDGDKSSLEDEFKLLSVSHTPDSFGKEITFYKRKNHNFRLPKALDSPVIMIGPGTGVAPFIGFIQHRLHQKTSNKIGKMYLYFGCRHKDLDFLFKDNLAEYCSKNVLTQLNTSFSRDIPPEGETHYKYVQDLIFKNKDEVVKAILEEGAYIYVCGDAKNMAKNVREKLITCIQDVKGLNEEAAVTKISELVSEKRYLQDVWA